MRVSLRDALRDAREILPGAQARLEAEVLLRHVLQRSQAWLYAHDDDALTDAQRAAFQHLLERRCRGEPIAYLLGYREFWSLPLIVTPATLIPRSDTEGLVECALALIPPDAQWTIADLGTGSGAVALALASERPLCRVIATDASPAALDVARNNAHSLKITNVEFACGDWCAALGVESFALIVSNPPYIVAGDDHLHEGDLRYEPASALVSGADGLDAIRAITAQARQHLLPDGWLVLEHGHEQGAAVRELLSKTGYVDVETREDLEHRDRVSLGRFGG
ncbi:MAG: peptide chain release factor N(5)-glutamine methyltransferase [Tahibacter sp.]